MEERAYEFELARVIATIRERGASSVGLQLPEGLKTITLSLAAAIATETSAEVIVSGNTCYGACDLDEQLLGLVDLLVHFGHTNTFSCSNRKPVPEGNYLDKVVFVELRSTVDLKSVVERAIPLIDGACIGLVATVQHVHSLAEAKRVLEGAGKSALIGKAALPGMYDGQVLGCEFATAQVPCDELLFIGSGAFHPAGLALYSGKRVIAADPFTQQLTVFEPDELRKKRYGAIARALDAEAVGILIGLKSGQERLSDALRLKRQAEAKGLTAFLIALDEITEERLLGFHVDAFVNTACPRLAEDLTHLRRPVLTMNEFEVVLGKRTWEQLWG
jgi:2-(3-amino-3-carboxypropyl)histidine synthase